MGLRFSMLFKLFPLKKKNVFVRLPLHSFYLRVFFCRAGSWLLHTDLSIAANRGYSLDAGCRLLVAVAPVVEEQGSRHTGFGSHVAQA